MLKRFSFTALITILLAFSSCETEFSLNGDYELTPVVFGLLDHTSDTHLVKITKAYLGDGDNLVYAQNPDSNYFNQVYARVVEYDKSGDKTGREWELNDSIITNKSTDGVFYAPEQKIYYFVESDLNSEFEYEIVADLNEGQKSFTARTSLIHNFSVQSTILASGFKIRFAKNTVDEDDDYLSWRFEVNEGLNAARYQIGYTFHWTEYYTDGTSASFSASKNESLEEQSAPDKPTSFSARISGLDFYKWIQSTIPDDSDVERRTADGFDLHLSVAHQTLSQYMDVAEPVSGIAQVQPVYTNVEGGYGLFSSRLLYSVEGMNFDAATKKELARGSYTVSKLFCSDDPSHFEEDYYCP